jgi:hypothetical protein
MDIDQLLLLSGDHIGRSLKPELSSLASMFVLGSGLFSADPPSKESYRLSYVTRK